MPKRIMITEYPVEYVPFNPPESKCFYGLPENQNLPDSNIPSMHYHSSYQIGVCLSGNGVFLLENDITIYIVIFDKNAYKISENSPYKGWDPTDPDERNPWHAWSKDE